MSENHKPWTVTSKHRVLLGEIPTQKHHDMLVVHLTAATAMTMSRTIAGWQMMRGYIKILK